MRSGSAWAASVRQRVYQITSRLNFPKPVANLAQGKVWLLDDVEAWIASRQSGSR